MVLFNRNHGFIRLRCLLVYGLPLCVLSKCKYPDALVSLDVGN